MDIIDARWVQNRLKGERGELRRLAEAVGLTQDKISKILSGERLIKAAEAPLFAAYFRGEPPQGLAESAAMFQGARARPVPMTDKWLAAIVALCPPIRHPSLYELASAEPGAAFAQGDVLIVDLNATPTPGGLVLVNAGDPDIGDFSTILRRFAPPFLLPLSGGLHLIPESAEPSAHSAIVATVIAMVRGAKDASVSA